MNPTLLSALSVIAFLAYLQAGLFVYFKNPSVSANRWFFVLTITLALWSAGLILHDPNFELYGGYPLFLISIAGANFFPLALVKYISELTGITTKPLHHKVILAMLITLCVYLLIFSFSNTEILGARLLEYSVTYHTMFFWLAVGYFSYLSIAVFAIILHFIEWRYHCDNPLEKNQYKFIRNALFFSFLAGIVIDLVLPHFGIIENLYIAHMFGLLYVGLITFGVFHLQLFSLTPDLAADSIVMRSNKIILFCNPSGWIFRSNPYAINLLELQENELLGRSIGSIFSDPLLILQTLHQAKKHSEAKELSVHLVSKSGKLIPVRISFLFVKDSFSDLLGIIVYGHDLLETIALENEISLRKQLELELTSLRMELEKRVIEKTSELSAAHKRLQNQLSERLLAEERIKADAEEKKLLINEIYNRVKDNMEMIIALIQTERSSHNHAADNAKLYELERRVKSILLIHQNLYFSTRYSQVDFTQFVASLVAELKQSSSSDKEVMFVVDIRETFLNFEIAMPLGLILNELLSNSLKHAWNHPSNLVNSSVKPTITVNLFAENNIFTLIVSDNGVGLPKDFILASATTNGLPLVEILAKDQIGGSFEVHSNNGMVSTVRFSG